VKAWELWNVSYRDVFILNSKQELIERINLTDLDLTEAENYEEFKTMLQATD